MKILLPIHKLFVLGVLVIIAANSVVFLFIVSNRSGQPESVTELTERELRLPYSIDEENSGLALRLSWRTLGKVDKDFTYGHWSSPEWFDLQKLNELGFKIDGDVTSVKNKRKLKRAIPKQVFIVLEYNGDLYKESLRRAQQHFAEAQSAYEKNSESKRARDNFKYVKKQLEEEYKSESRLFAIDAGLDAQLLREKYSDRSRFIITNGMVRPSYNYGKENSEVYGIVTDISVNSIHVPLDKRIVFDVILFHDKIDSREPKLPRFTVELAYGSRYEPWILKVHMIEEKL